MKSKLIKLLIFLTAVGFSGCSSMPKIKYTVQLPVSGTRNVFIHIQDFEDTRGSYEIGKLGGVYNGYNMRLGDVKEPPGLVQSIQSAFMTEIKNSGYQVVSDDRDLVLRGILQSVTCDSGNSKQSDLKVRLILKDKGDEVLDQVYQGKSNVFFTLDTSCSRPLVNALEQVVSKFVRDLNEYVNT